MAPSGEENQVDTDASNCDFELLNFLLKAPSKDVVKKLLQDSFIYLNSEVPRKFYEQTSSSLGIQVGDARKMLLSISELMKVALFNSMTDPEDVYSLFPDDFHKSLRELLSKLIAECMFLTSDLLDEHDHKNNKIGSDAIRSSIEKMSWRSDTISQQVSLPRLADFDWRIDVKTGSSGRMAVPSCLLQLKVDSDILNGDITREGARSVNVELTKETLETMLDGLAKIRLQLSSVVAR